MPVSEDASAFPHPQFTTRSELQPHKYPERTVHTSTFKVFEYGRKAPELMVEELDDAGYLKIKTPEAFFHGIVGHVRDRQGQRVDGWAQSATLANYWRRYYNIAENKWPYHDYDDSQQDTLPQVTDPAAEAPAPSQVPQPITHRSHLLHGILLQRPDGNSSILETLNAASSSLAASLNYEGLAQLAGHLAILSHYLARHGSVTTGMSEGSDLFIHSFVACHWCNLPKKPLCCGACVCTISIDVKLVYTVSLLQGCQARHTYLTQRSCGMMWER